MLSGLDPHSTYLNPKHFRDMQVQTRGEFGGLGIEVTMEEGVVKVVSPIENTPAEKAGVMSGDLITHLDGVSIQGLTLEQAVEKMRGPVDTPIVITVLRTEHRAVRRQDHARRHPHQSGPGEHGRRRHRLYPRQGLQRADL